MLLSGAGAELYPDCIRTAVGDMLSPDRNPFNAGWGVAPPVFVGREDIFHQVLANLHGGPGRADYVTIILGPRGVGKTVLLRRLRDHVVAEHGWLVMDWLAGPDVPFAAALEDQYPAVREQLAGRRSRISGGQLGVAAGGFGASLNVGPRARPATVVGRLRELGDLARQQRTQVVIMIDELQAAGHDSLRQLATGLQQTNGDGLPVALVAVGLPTTPSRLAEVRDVTFLERQRFHSIGNLSPEDAARAIEQPFLNAGRSIATDALDRLTVYSNGYPYAVQEVGHHTWEAAGSAPHVTLGHADAGIAATAVTFDSIFARRWAKLSPGQRAYIRTVAELADADGTAGTAAIIERMGVVRTTAAKHRDELIKRHQLLYAPSRGRVASALPGFLPWLRARHQSVEPHADVAAPERDLSR
jgi:type II secretory pathway predicted ATPase ExeA